jgi:membrane-associated protease RseP (regulator of RpoE activity)
MYKKIKSKRRIYKIHPISFKQMPDEYKPPDSSANIPTNLDIELLKSEVGQYFPFYDMKYGLDTAIFSCRIDETLLENNFDLLRISLSKKGYIPMLRYENGEHTIYIIKKPERKKKPIWINIVLLIATIITTTLAGSFQWVSIDNTDILEMLSPYYILNGFVFFSIPLLLILGIHEMGHYFASKKHNIEASLPYFIPLPPPIFILGTFGALISTREPIPNRKALLDIGAAGPICGFLVAIPVSLLGLFFMQQNPMLPSGDGGGITIMFPLILQFLSSFFVIPQNTIIHPTAFAGWVGLFVTSLNLLPVGQLDGGHVSRALFKEKSKYLTWVVIGAILVLGLFYAGWFIFFIFIIFLLGTHHPAPLNELQQLDIKRKIIGLAALIIFVLCFASIPMS